MRSRARKRIAALAIGLIAALAGTATFLTDAFEDTEFDSVDARFEIRGERDESRVAVVAIDDVTFSELGVQWPFPRSLHGRVIDRLSAAGASAIAYDVQFTEPSTRREDNALVRATGDAGNVVLSTTEVDDRGRTNVFGGADLSAIGARAGNTVIVPDSGGIFRRIHHEVQGLTGFAVAAAEVATGGPVDPADFDDDGSWIDYRGQPGSDPHLLVLAGPARRGRPRRLRGQGRRRRRRGADAPGRAPDLDRRRVDVGRRDPGERGRDRARRGPAAFAPRRRSSIAVIALLAFLTPLCGLRLRPLVTLAVAIAAAGVYLVVAQLAFNAGLVLPVVYPLVALLIGGRRHARHALPGRRLRAPAGSRHVLALRAG